MNELLKKYIKDNNINLNCFKVNELSPFLVELTDVNNHRLSLMNMFEDIIVYIDDKESGTYYFNNKMNLWLVKRG